MGAITRTGSAHLDAAATVPTFQFDAPKVERKLRLAAGLFDMAFQVKRTQLQAKHPELSDREINHRVYALIEKGCR